MVIKPLKQYFRMIVLSAACGGLAGLSSWLFLVSLKWVTELRLSNPIIIWGLPLAGLFIGWIYHRFGYEANRGNNLIIDEIHDPKKIVPLRMAPLVFIGTILTHLFGGSAGREGTAVQMGATLSDQLAKIFGLPHSERKVLLMCGAGAGFGAAIGAPWAGAIFGMEVLYVGRFPLVAWLECLVASFIGFGVARLFGAPHTQFILPEIPPYSVINFFYVALASVVFGLLARGFSLSAHLIEKFFLKWVKYKPLSPFFGGLLLVGLYFLEGSYRFAGLGISEIQNALSNPGHFLIPLEKGIFTALTVGSGFKGGEFIPLVFMGATMGSALSVVLPLSFSLLAAVGFAAVFGAASNTPLACAIMAMELFGYKIGPYALIACGVSYMFAGPSGIYRAQRRT